MLDTFHPLVATWFRERFGTPTEPQALGWPTIAAGRDTLIAAPTGSGKTLAAFLFCLDKLVREALDGRLADETQVVYISPLKALGNDIEKNLEVPLRELTEAAARAGLALPEIRTFVRTGDTPASKRAAMRKRPPHILITTPESLYLLLTSESGRKMLAPAHTVIVDEIHAVARDKRGAHLALSLERLDALCGGRLTRIGLSATQSPIEEIARFLVGSAHVSAEGIPDCAIVNTGHRRPMDLAIEVPSQELSSVASNEQWDETYDRVAELVGAHKSTLIFVNTRRHVERASHALGARLGKDNVAAHHGSLSRLTRLKAEQSLKTGAAKAVVATASLELGIDVGHVELVVQFGSPRAFGVALQRIGRSGHWRGATPKGRLFPGTRDELVECAAVVRGLRAGALERTTIPSAPLDVLAQQIVAESSCRDLGEDDLFSLVRRAWPYRALLRKDFDDVIVMHAEGVATRRGRSMALLHRDGVHHILKGRRGAGLAALTSGGAIPDTAQYAVVAEPDGLQVGTLDEDFAIESMAGDIFQLGNTSWRIRRVEAGRVRVEDAGGAAPTIPFWLGEAPGRSPELSGAVSLLREEIEQRLIANDAASEPGDGASPALPDGGRRVPLADTATWLADASSMPPAGAAQAVAYLAAGRAALGALPTQKTLVAERFFDEAGGMQLIIHAPFGMRINRAFGLALRKRFCMNFDFELQAAATDDAVLLSLGPQNSFPLESISDFLSPNGLEVALTKAALQAPMFGVRWRWNATRSLAVLRSSGGKRTPPNILRMRAEDLLAAVFPEQLACQENATGPRFEELPDHPLVKETLHDCLNEAMDLPALTRLFTQIANGDVRIVARDTPEPSPLCHEILHARPYAFLDDAPLEERRARAVATRRSLPPTEIPLGALDPAAISEVAAQVWPDIRDADDLHDALLNFVLLPDAETAAWDDQLQDLVTTGRAARIVNGGPDAWVAAERLSLARAAFPDAVLEPAIAATSSSDATIEEADVPIVRGWISVLPPMRSGELAARLQIPSDRVESALLRLESQGLVLRGPEKPEPTFCERSILARIHRLTLGRLRREIAPVSTADFMRFLARWQHAHEGTQVHGPRGLLEVIRQLQGFQIAAGAWERDVLPARVANYDPQWLDHLCLTGEVAWGRLCPTRAEDDNGEPVRRATPTRAAPITLVLRSDLPWLLAASADPQGPAPLGASAAALLEVLAKRGASFLGELVTAIHRTPAELEQALWELVAAGEVTCDAFAGVRALIGPPPRKVPRQMRGPLERWAPRHSRENAARGGGRWTILRPREVANENPETPLPPLRGRVRVGGSANEASTENAPPKPRAIERRNPFDVAPEIELLAAQYLRRYGVVFRDLLAREPRCPPWRDLLLVYRRQEARGELRGGRFVDGWAGEQFALPEAVEAIRAVRRLGTRSERLEVSAADPLNFSGILLPGERVPAVMGQRLLLVDGMQERSEQPMFAVASEPLH